MSEGNRGSRVPPKLSKALKSGTSPSKEPRPPASGAAQAESSGGAAQAKRSASQSAAAEDQSGRGVQDAQAALSALQLSTSGDSTVQRRGTAAAGPLESPASEALRSRAGPSGAAPGSLSTPTSSRSSQTQVAANLPSRTARPKAPVSQGEAAELSAGNLTSKPDSTSPQVAGDQRLPGAKSGPSGTPRSASQPTEPRLTRSRRGPLPAAPAAQGGPASKERSTRQGGPGTSSGLRIPRFTHNPPSRSSLADPTSKEKSAPRSGGGAARAGGPADSSASGTLGGGLARDAASLSRGRLGEPAGAALLTSAGQIGQTGAADTTSSLMGPRSGDPEASASEQSSSEPEYPTQSRPRSRPRSRSYDNQTRSQVFAYLAQKMAAAEIRSRTGVSTSTIALWKKNWALEADPFAATRGQHRSRANRQGRRAYDPQTRARVALYLTEDMPAQQISDRTGISLATIHKWRKEEARLPPNLVQGVAWSQEVRERVAALLDRGMPVAEVNEKTGVPLSTIYLWKREDSDASSS